MASSDAVLGVFLVGCRVGGCLMLMPGFSSARVPARVRLLLAVVMALAMAPVVLDEQAVSVVAGAGLARTIFAETIAGSLIGLVARIFIASLSFMASALSSYIGLSGLGDNVEAQEAAPTIATIVTVVATLILLIADMHRFMIAAVIESYERLPLATMLETDVMLRLVSSSLQAAFMVGLQVVGPFVIYGILINLMFGILGKLIPQLPSYFISVPFLAGGGLLLLYFSIGQMIEMFTSAFQSMLSSM